MSDQNNAVRLVEVLNKYEEQPTAKKIRCAFFLWSALSETFTKEKSRVKFMHGAIFCFMHTSVCVLLVFRNSSIFPQLL